MDKMIYLAAQYLAAAGKSFVEHQADDSHTNLGLNADNSEFTSRDFNVEGDHLALNLDDFSLRWKSQDSIDIKGLHNTSHAEVVQWLNDISMMRLNKPYRFDLHYDIGTELNDAFRFELMDKKRLKELFDLRILAEDALSEFLTRKSLVSEIRIWPHHFDTGAFVSGVNETGLALGFGMAVPDSLIEDYYFYFSGYQGHDGVDTLQFDELTRGEWLNENFKGAVLPVSDLDMAEVAVFLDEAHKEYTK